MPRASELLRQAARHYDAPQSKLPEQARQAAMGGFSAGAEWMRLALQEMRAAEANSCKISVPPCGTAPWQCLGVAKYLLACFAGITAVVFAWLMCRGWVAYALLLPGVAGAGILSFYFVEVQWVFLFPVALDTPDGRGAASACKVSRDLMRRHTGSLAALVVVIPLAWCMLTGGLRGGGFLRSWCLGCLAVLCWYERCRLGQVGDFVTREEETLLLELGGRGSVLLRTEHLEMLLPAKANAADTASQRILFLSDLHLTCLSADRLLTQLSGLIAAVPADLIVLGGDLAETTGGLIRLGETLAKWTLAGHRVAAVPGNHDAFLGMKKVRAVLKQHQVHWLPDGDYVLPCGQIVITSQLEPQATNTAGKNRILCLHNPADWGDLNKGTACWQENGPRAVLAGHLHGGQVVLFKKQEKLYPGAWIYRWNALRITSPAPGPTYYGSRGCGDTLPLRWNCPREALLLVLTSIPSP